jgi:hypothetical protein
VNYPPAAPIGSVYESKVFKGITETQYVGTLTYMWGAKGTSGIDPKPYYCIPVLGGNVCEWVAAELVMLPIGSMNIHD